MKIKKFNYVICGGGASGLLLASKLISDTFFSNKNVLLIEKDPKNLNDRTWCFWEKGKGELDHIVSKSWKSAIFKAKNFKTNFSTDPYTYKLIRGIDFYKNFNYLKTKQQNLTYLNTKINSIDKRSNTVKTDKGDFIGDFIFTSLLDFDKLINYNKYPLLKQHFVGQLIKTKNEIFNPDEVTFMDFDIPQKDSTRFMYVLPLSKSKALIEYTLFSPKELDKNEYISSIEQYMKNLNPGNYKIIETEKGIIPMSAYKFTSENTKNLLNIGTAGGWTKPSTGYTFLNTLNKTNLLVSYLKMNKPLNEFEKNSRFWFYDLLFLDVLNKHNDKGSQLFKKMFEKNKPETIFKFLDNKTNIFEEIKMMLTFKKRWFVQALIKRFF
jgi:lycopene beta-cyclase|tara:strand:+ start:81 stop:1220 length:1140 start_codon:yes stop_codon:yes gene_type:complete